MRIIFEIEFVDRLRFVKYELIIRGYNFYLKLQKGEQMERELREKYFYSFDFNDKGTKGFDVYATSSTYLTLIY